MINYADTPEAERPALETETRGGRVYVRCPVLGVMAPGFAVYRLDPDIAAGLGVDWACSTAIQDYRRQTRVPPIEELRAAKWDAAKHRRAMAERGGVATAFGAVDTGPSAQLAVVGAVTRAQLAMSQAEPWSIDWTLADNATVTMTAADVIAMGIAVAAHVDAVHQRGRALRTAIDAAADAAALDAIDIERGWP